MPSKTALALAANTQRLMADRGWSQRDLAKAARVSQKTISHVVTYADANDRHAKLDTVDALAHAFGVSPAELIGFTERKNVVLIGTKRGAPIVASPAAVSQSLRLEELTMALELTDQVLQGKSLGAAKRAELISLVYEGLVDGLPEAKVLRLARTSVK